ncbi:hypothetical protein RchiOBHm_Chr3g0454781 [Rosa chinensis]|uniref:Uncharacterized protein n=1 Tax=Rosa chinensis TaxID=74649 RepID=A0A2P6R6W6_ROSCH|nr:hypothetical protein RchiOBHm_Chr3g0454781 [Rosa chinensis]
MKAWVTSSQLSPVRRLYYQAHSFFGPVEPNKRKNDLILLRFELRQRPCHYGYCK